MHNDSPPYHEASQALMNAGFHKLLGYKQGRWAPGETEVFLDVKPHHLNLGGVVHGGVLSTLLDIVCAQSGTYCPTRGNVRKAITLSLTTSFTGQCQGGTLRAVGKVRAKGSRVYHASGEVFDDKGNLLAMGEGTFRLRSGSEQESGVPLTS